ncbi:uncharacterized protein BROUX77_005930 [Berkeleyomyces rouxiae]|uniref:uncharacterized protein n=1 Tax=Berkeleyomyces rouxiae TaxID=2035830 RepID=UPI003B813D5D
MARFKAQSSKARTKERPEHHANGITRQMQSKSKRSSGASGADSPETLPVSYCPFSTKLLPDALDAAELNVCRRCKTDFRAKESAPGTQGFSRYQPFSFRARGALETHASLDGKFVVEPRDKWYSMTRYQHFKLNSIEFRVGMFIWVANDQTAVMEAGNVEQQLAGPAPNMAKKLSEYGWVGRILEIRAHDEDNVFVRLVWMYWPDELVPCRLVGGSAGGTADGSRIIQGRQQYHGWSEMIASNHMDIINAMTVSARATVTHWKEDDLESHSCLYWRQALDVRTSELTAVAPRCICRAPENPDAILVGCPSDTCREWLHDTCILDSVLNHTFARLGTTTAHLPSNPAEAPPPHTTETAAAAGMSRKSKGPTRPWLGYFSARLVRDEESEALPGASRHAPPLVEVTDLRGLAHGIKVWTVGVSCLFCGTKIE